MELLTHTQSPCLVGVEVEQGDHRKLLVVVVVVVVAELENHWHCSVEAVAVEELEDHRNC